MNKSILLTYDFLGTSAVHGVNNQNWIFGSFVEVIRKLPVEVCHGLTGFDRHTFFRLSDMNAGDKTFVEFNTESISEKALSYVKNHIESYDLIVGCELSASTREIFKLLDITFIDIWLSPIRFYKDVMFEFDSNNIAIQNTLKSFAFDEKLLFEHIEKLKSHVSNFVPRMRFPSGSCLIVSQVEQDKSLLSDGKFLSLLDFIPQLNNLGHQYEKLYLLKHPNLNNHTFSKLCDDLSNISNLEILKEQNTYTLLMDENIECVAGVSSSVLTEAKYFEKSVEYFFKPVVLKRYIRIFNHYFSTNFWAQLLTTGDRDNISLFAPDNYLRLKYGMTYAYSIFLPNDVRQETETQQNYKNIQNLYNFINNLNSKDKYILYGFGSIGKLIYPHVKKQLLAIADENVAQDELYFESIPLINPKNLSLFPDAKIIVSPFLYNESIVENLASEKDRLIFIES